MRAIAFCGGAIAFLASGILLPPVLASADGPPVRVDRCGGATGAAHAICSAFLIQRCDLEPHRSCESLRRVFTRLSGSPLFPFELVPTPTATLSLTRTPTPTPTAGIAAAGTGPASLLVFPRILATSDRDTLVEIANVDPAPIDAHCFYLNGAPADPTQPVSPANPRHWQSIDYTIHLTGRQPTQWRVSAGRPLDPTDPPTLPGAGLDPGNIPAAPPGFTGELRCFQTDVSGTPVGGNAMTGTATLLGPGEEVAAYDAIGFRGLAVDGDTVLHLDGVEYDACADRMDFLHRADGPIVPSLLVANVFTVVPCSVDYETQVPVHTQLNGIFIDELEQFFSANLLSTYWDEFGKAQLGIVLDNLGGALKRTELFPALSVCIGGPTPGAVCSGVGDCGVGATCKLVPALAVLESTRTFAIGNALRAVDVQDPHLIGAAVPAAMQIDVAP